MRVEGRSVLRKGWTYQLIKQEGNEVEEVMREMRGKKEISSGRDLFKAHKFSR
jgi:hypothetical protein